MARMYDNYESPSIYFGDSSQWTNWILDSVQTCHMIPNIQYFIPLSLEDTDKNIEYVYKHHVMAKQKGQIIIKMCDDYGDTFIAKFHNLLFALNLCNRLF